MRNCSQHDTKTVSNIDDKSMKFRNLRFLVFCQEYNVKIVFLHDQGCQNSIENRFKIDANSILQKCMLKSREMSQIRSQMGAKIEKISTENEVGKNIEILSQKSIRPLSPRGSLSRLLSVENLPKNTTKEKKQQRGVHTRWGTSTNEFQHAWEPAARSGFLKRFGGKGGWLNSS